MQYSRKPRWKYVKLVFYEEAKSKQLEQQIQGQVPHERRYRWIQTEIGMKEVNKFVCVCVINNEVNHFNHETCSWWKDQNRSCCCGTCAVSTCIPELCVKIFNLKWHRDFKGLDPPPKTKRNDTGRYPRSMINRSMFSFLSQYYHFQTAVFIRLQWTWIKICSMAIDEIQRYWEWLHSGGH